MAHNEVLGKQALDGTLGAMCRLLGLAEGKRGTNLVGKTRLEGLAECPEFLFQCIASELWRAIFVLLPKARTFGKRELRDRIRRLRNRNVSLRQRGLRRGLP